jgi:hypothetical protein
MTGFTFLSGLTQIAPPHTRFVFLGAGIRLGLPSHPASRRRSCLRLGVSITSSSRGLSPPSDRPCRAYSRRRLRRRWPGVSARAQPLVEARPAHAGPHARRARRSRRLIRARKQAQHTAVFLTEPLSSSRAPHQWRPFGPSHAIGSRRPLTRRPLPWIPAPTRKSGQDQETEPPLTQRGAQVNRVTMQGQRGNAPVRSHRDRPEAHGHA